MSGCMVTAIVRVIFPDGAFIYAFEKFIGVSASVLPRIQSMSSM